MRSFTLSIVAAVLLAVLNVNTDLIAWSGTICTGDEGLNVALETAIRSQGTHLR